MAQLNSRNLRFLGVLLLLLSASVKGEECSWTDWAPWAVLGGAAAVVATPVAVGALGFTAAGIAAGSVAAALMSAAATLGVGGGVVATLQSVGAAGLGLAGAAKVATVGAAATNVAYKQFVCESGDKKC